MAKTLHIKNMVCPRCIMSVETALKTHDIDFESISLGEVILRKQLLQKEKDKLEKTLEELGFEILSNKKVQLIEQIKNLIINMVHHQNQPEKIGHLGEQLPKLLGQSYSSLSNLFSDVVGITIEKYLILQKIEKAKELLIYEELSVKEIAYFLNYSSSQHFSRQFKELTGLSPSSFIKNKKVKRKPISDF